jgi:hypothetical protein
MTISNKSIQYAKQHAHDHDGDLLSELLREAIAIFPGDTIARQAWKASALKIANAREQIRANRMVTPDRVDGVVEKLLAELGTPGAADLDAAGDYAGFLERGDRFEQV